LASDVAAHVCACLKSALPDDFVEPILMLQAFPFLEVKSSALPEIISTFLQAHELQVLVLVGIVHWLRDILAEEELLSQPNIQSKNNSKAKKLKELEDELRQMRALFKNVASRTSQIKFKVTVGDSQKDLTEDLSSSADRSPLAVKMVRFFARSIFDVMGMI
jgi:hypothetical protein